MLRPQRLLPLLLVAALAVPGTAGASDLIDRNASGVRLQVNERGEALVTYRARGRRARVLAWGALNARHPARGARQVSFRLDYAGGWGKYGRPVWRGFQNTCAPYRGPRLAWLVAACTARDGSHWALQAWRRALPAYGVPPAALQGARELRLSHWTGPIARLEVSLDWAYRRYHHLFGRFTYRGRPVHGFRSTSTGAPLDSFGRNVYIDTFDSAYGEGWRRENGILTHGRTGAFCYGFFPHGSRPSGRGERYRATISGPGVTPDVMWSAGAPGEYDRRQDEAANAEIRALGDSLCSPN